MSGESRHAWTLEQESELMELWNSARIQAVAKHHKQAAAELIAAEVNESWSGLRTRLSGRAILSRVTLLQKREAQPEPSPKADPVSPLLRELVNEVKGLRGDVLKLRNEMADATQAMQEIATRPLPLTFVPDGEAS